MKAAATTLTPSPVFDRLAAADKFYDQEFFGGSFAEFMAEASTVPALTFSDEYSAFSDSFENVTYPEAREPLFAKPLWVEAVTPIIPNLVGTKVWTGVLFGEIEIPGWSFPLLSARFVALTHSCAVPIAGQLLISITGPDEDWNEYRATVAPDPALYGFADFERVRHGLTPAIRASNEQLLRMHTSIVVKGDELLFADVSEREATYYPFPNRGLIDETGFEGLGLALARCSFRRDWLVSRAQNALPVRLFNNLLGRGPALALNLLALAAKALRGDGVATRIPEPFARGRVAQFISTEKDRPNASAWSLAEHVTRSP